MDVNIAVKRNILNNMVATFISITIPLIVIPILTRDLGVDDYGNYVTIIAKAALFNVILEFGLGMYVSKEISTSIFETNKINDIISSFLNIKILALILIVLFHCFLFDFNFTDVIFYLVLLSQLVNLECVLNGLEEYKKIAFFQFISRGMMLFLVMIVDFTHGGINLALTIYALSNIIFSLLTVFFLIKSKVFFRYVFNVKKIGLIIKGGFGFYSAKVLVNIYQQSSTYLVSFVLPNNMVAIYSIGIQLYKVGQLIIGSVSKVLYTTTIRTKDFKMIFTVTTFSLLVLSLSLPIVIFFGSDILSFVFYFNVDVLSSISIYLYISLFFVVISSYYGYPALSPINKDNYAHLGIFISSVSYFVIYGLIWFIGYVDIYSFIFCIVIADFIGMLVRIIFARKFNVIQWKRSKEDKYARTFKIKD